VTEWKVIEHAGLFCWHCREKFTITYTNIYASDIKVRDHDWFCFNCALELRPEVLFNAVEE